MQAASVTLGGAEQIANRATEDRMRFSRVFVIISDRVGQKGRENKI